MDELHNKEAERLQVADELDALVEEIDTVPKPSVNVAVKKPSMLMMVIVMKR